MNRAFRRLSMAVLIGIAVLVIALTYQQAIAGPGYAEDPRNVRVFADLTTTERGNILTADGVVVARSEMAGDGTYVRVYPEGDLYAHTVGYAASGASNGIERTRAADLRPQDDGTLGALLTELFGADIGPQSVYLTIDHDIQRAAYTALGEQKGAVVALDPATGAVLALVSTPSYDPNIFTTGSTEELDQLLNDEEGPLLNRALTETYAPGSSFKLVVTMAALETGFADPETLLPDIDELALPNSLSTITNAQEGYCGNGQTVSLQQALVISCNTAFAQLGMDLGAEAIVDTAEAAGFNHTISFELPTIDSVIPEASTFINDDAALAQTSLGQRDVRATPMQMALIAAAVANNGTAMRPYLVGMISDSGGHPVSLANPQTWRRVISAESNADLSLMMEQVVFSGTGWRAAVPGLRVFGKTGTAEVPDAAPHTWFVGFAVDTDGEAIAVAVLVESGGYRGEEGTGGSVAAPVAQAVFSAWRDS
jgi:peptidoglycan glycosyltransferase